jgi:hypothetical protein
MDTPPSSSKNLGILLVVISVMQSVTYLSMENFLSRLITSSLLSFPNLPMSLRLQCGVQSDF